MFYATVPPRRQRPCRSLLRCAARAETRCKRSSVARRRQGLHEPERCVQHEQAVCAAPGRGRGGVEQDRRLVLPRTTSQRPFDKYWNSELTIVQLRYEFLYETSPNSYFANLGNGQRTGLSPLDVGRVYFSFWDTDTGEPQFSGSDLQLSVFSGRNEIMAYIYSCR